MLILASQSPRRKEILERAGFVFTVQVPDVDESVLDDEAPQSYVRRIAARKATTIQLAPGDCVLAADTTVVVDNQTLGKPVDTVDAARMLGLLQGRSHEVLTGICIRFRNQIVVDGAVTLVHFDAMSDSDIARYVASGEPMDKAGAYGIQGLASRYITGIEGCYYNVMGLPVSLVARHLQRLGAG
ncbi:MAG: septum formation inhibitor Maf [Acidobacteria bacterium]|nr:septum formation inhibitor Maf [Acidobacteriota bacterium]